MIRLLVDSASDYTQEEIRNKNLYFVPLQIQIEGKNYLDGVDIDKETVNSHAFHACIHGFESRTRHHFSNKVRKDFFFYSKYIFQKT